MAPIVSNTPPTKRYTTLSFCTPLPENDTYPYRSDLPSHKTIHDPIVFHTHSRKRYAPILF